MLLLHATALAETDVDLVTENLKSSWCDHIKSGKTNMIISQLSKLKSTKGFKMANLNINSLLKSID